MNDLPWVCAAHVLDGPFTLGRGLLARVGAYGRQATSLQEQIVYSFVDPGSALQSGGTARSLSLVVRPELQTRFFGTNHVRFLCHALVSMLEQHDELDDLALAVCHVDMADETDRELLRALRTRARHRRRPDPVPARPVDVGDDTDRYPDPARRGIYDVPAHLSPDARKSWHDSRAVELRETLDPSAYRDAVVYHLLRGNSPARAMGYLGGMLADAVRRGFYEAALRYGRQLFELWARPVEYDASYHMSLQAYCTALTATGRSHEALSVYRTAAARWTDPALHATMHYVAAMVHARHGSAEVRDLGRAFESLGRAVAAAERIEDATKRAHQRAFLDNATALLEMRRGDLIGAVALIESGLDTLDEEYGVDEQLQHRVVSRANRATLLSRLGRVDEAIDDLDYVVANDPYVAEYRVDRAIARHAAGRDQDAMADLTFAIDHCVTGPEAYHNRAMLRLAAGDRKGAIADLRRAYHLEPSGLDVFAALGESLIAAEMFDEAADLLSDPPAVVPDDRLAVLNSRLATARSNPARALRTLDRALDLAPASPLLRTERATVLYSLGRPECALADIEVALSQGELDHTVQANRAILLAECGRITEAGDVAARLLEDDGLTPDVEAHLRQVLTSARVVNGIG
jgi:tetratricopeptide (TPR) repeat protein